MIDTQRITGITISVLHELKRGVSRDSRALRDFILNLSNPNAYEFTLQRFSEMSDSSFEVALGMLRAVRKGSISQGNLDHVAAQLEDAADQSDACLEMIGSTSIRVVVAKKHVARVSTKHIGHENAIKKARWIRDNYLFESKGSAKIRKPPTVRKGSVKRISLISDANRFIFLVRFQGTTGRPTTKQFSIIELGFDGAFRAALEKAKEQSPNLDLQMQNPYRPTPEEYAHFKPLVPDLPGPEVS